MKTLIEREIEKGVSRRALASRVGVSLGTVQNILYGDTEIKNSTLEKFARYFKVPIDRPSISSPTAATSAELMEMQRSIIKLHECITALGSEIGRIKDRLLDAAESGDVHRLRLVASNGRK